MRDIYSSADRVNVWLGVPTSNIFARAADSLALLRRWITPEQGRLERIKPWVEWLRECLVRLPTAYCLLNQTPHRIAEALGGSKPWWTSRVWCVQDYVLGKKIYLCYGRTEMLYNRKPFGVLCKAYQAHSGTTLRVLNRLERILYNYELEKPKSLLEAARMTKDAAAGDPRDKVYALLGILPHAATDRIMPDYTLSPWKVYAQPTFASMIAANSLDSLALATAKPSTEPDLPSWALHFSRVSTAPQPGLEGFVYTGWEESDVEDDEDEDTGVRWPGCDLAGPPASLSQDMRQLSVQGITFATVSAFYHCPSVPANIKDDDSITRLYSEDSTLMRPSEDELLMLLRSAKGHLVGEGPEPGYNEIAYLADSSQDKKMLNDSPLASLRRKEGSIPSAEDIIGPWLESWDREVNLQNPFDGGESGHGADVRGARTSAIAFVGYGQTWGVLDCFAMSNGFVGMASVAVLEGDTITLVNGCKYPVLLRSYGANWKFVGICLIHGIDHGQLLEIWDRVELRNEDFVLC
ncbi:hypothetical protein LTR56_020658 [Elasticomyces elasticus]|nr:hypothetical protein LTR56_020658 [Elasticomyces elasticus]KAK3653125.1 hypothetical protein LTR22_011363 [Elasticomyces elasticus]KAK4919633.1 hypothetical protein LTR49_012697 [Elasticomyces elasticus]KAK5751220.1 hypothetical protein LTS12_018694 [Elasticomyces elasticus]